MMTKKSLMTIFKKHNGVNFSISTCNAVGRGINGVSYNEYRGCVMGGEKFTYVAEETKIIGFMEDCVVLEHNTNSNYWDDGKHIIYLPYDCIVAVDIVDVGRERYPLKLNFKHNLKEIR